MTRDNQKVALSVALEPPDINGLPYSPALLLDGRFGAVITDHPEFARACEAGFEGYYETLSEDLPPSGRFSLGMVLSFVSDWTMNATKSSPRVPEWWVVPFPWAFGFTLGWLSALAFHQYQEAEQGLSELQRLYEQEQGVLHG